MLSVGPNLNEFYDNEAKSQVQALKSIQKFSAYDQYYAIYKQVRDSLSGVMASEAKRINQERI